MPQNDLLQFDILEPEGEPVGAPAVVVDSWAAAVRQLWLTPRPRVIAVTGGTRFAVVGGPGLQVRGRAVADGDERRDVFRFRGDAATPDEGGDVPRVGAPVPEWTPVRPVAESYADEPSWCQLVSGFGPTCWYGGPLPGTRFAFATGVGDGACVAEPEARTMLRVTPLDASAADERGRLPTGGAQVVTRGTLQARVRSEAAPAEVTVAFHRLAGDTVLRGLEYWHGMAYGWVVGDVRDAGSLLAYQP